VYTGYFGQGFTKYMVIYGVYMRFWPTLNTTNHVNDSDVGRRATDGGITGRAIGCCPCKRIKSSVLCFSCRTGVLAFYALV